MVGLFLSSSIPGEISGSASRSVAEAVQRIIPIGVETLNFFVRKGAHITVYLILGFSVAQALKYHLRRGVHVFAWAWGIASLYGVADEIHQYFVPGRVCSISDILINAAGAFVGAGIVWWMIRKKDSTPLR